MTTAELEKIILVKINPGWHFVLFRGRLFHREVDGSWAEYPSQQ
jgi:hypothetical protein